MAVAVGERRLNAAEVLDGDDLLADRATPLRSSLIRHVEDINPRAASKSDPRRCPRRRPGARRAVAGKQDPSREIAPSTAGLAGYQQGPRGLMGGSGGGAAQEDAPGARPAVTAEDRQFVALAFGEQDLVRGAPLAKLGRRSNPAFCANCAPSSSAFRALVSPSAAVPLRPAPVPKEIAMKDRAASGSAKVTACRAASALPRLPLTAQRMSRKGAVRGSSCVPFIRDRLLHAARSAESESP